jgi:hypothetical protein
VELAHSARLIRSSKRQAPPEGCAVKLYGAVTDAVLKLGVAAPDRPWSVNRVVTALLPPPTPLLSLPVVRAGLPQETNPTTRTRTALTSPPLEPLVLDLRRSALYDIDYGNSLLYK